MRTIVITASALVVLGRQMPLQAQQLHQGFWIGFAPGGAAQAGSEGFGYPYYLRFGGTLHQRVLFGVETHTVIWENAFGRSSSNVTATTLLYPSKQGGLFTKPGIGIGWAACGNSTTVRFGSTLGVGYDLRLGRNFYLTPNVDLLMLTIPRCPGADTRLGFSFTLGVTWH